MAAFAAASSETSETAWREAMAEGSRSFEDGRLADAEAAAARAVHYAEGLPSGDIRLAQSLQILGFLCERRSHYPDAKRAYLRAIHLLESSGPGHARELAITVDSLIGVYMQNEEYAVARKLIATRIAQLEAEGAPPRLLSMRASLAYAEHRYSDAAALLEQFLLGDGITKDDRASALMNLVAIYASTHQNGAALSDAVRALPLLESLDSPVSPRVARVLASLGWLSARLGSQDNAAAYYAQSLQIAKTVYGMEDRTTGEIMYRCADTLRQVGRKDEAKELARQASAILSRSPAPDGTVDVIELGLLSRFPR